MRSKMWTTSLALGAAFLLWGGIPAQAQRAVVAKPALRSAATPVRPTSQVRAPRATAAAPRSPRVRAATPAPARATVAPSRGPRVRASQFASSIAPVVSMPSATPVAVAPRSTSISRGTVRSPSVMPWSRNPRSPRPRSGGSRASGTPAMDHDRWIDHIFVDAPRFAPGAVYVPLLAHPGFRVLDPVEPLGPADDLIVWTLVRLSGVGYRTLVEERHQGLSWAHVLWDLDLTAAEVCDALGVACLFAGNDISDEELRDAARRSMGGCRSAVRCSSRPRPVLEDGELFVGPWYDDLDSIERFIAGAVAAQIHVQPRLVAHLRDRSETWAEVAAELCLSPQVFDAIFNVAPDWIDDGERCSIDYPSDRDIRMGAALLKEELDRERVSNELVQVLQAWAQ